MDIENFINLHERDKKPFYTDNADANDVVSHLTIYFILTITLYSTRLHCILYPPHLHCMLNPYNLDIQVYVLLKYLRLYAPVNFSSFRKCI